MKVPPNSCGNLGVNYNQSRSDTSTCEANIALRSNISHFRREYITFPEGENITGGCGNPFPQPPFGLAFLIAKRPRNHVWYTVNPEALRCECRARASSRHRKWYIFGFSDEKSTATRLRRCDFAMQNHWRELAPALQWMSADSACEIWLGVL